METYLEPLLEPVPDRIVTARLVIRPPHADDAAALNAAVCESIDELRPFLPWARTEPSMQRSEADCRRMQAKFLLREDLAMMFFERRGEGTEGDLIGGTGLHRIDWKVRRFEIGYWCRTSRRGLGLVTEAVDAMRRTAFEDLQARRVEVRMDDDNARSWRVAERAGARLEGVLRADSLTPTGEPRDTRVYAWVKD